MFIIKTNRKLSKEQKALVLKNLIKRFEADTTFLTIKMMVPFFEPNSLDCSIELVSFPVSENFHFEDDKMTNKEAANEILKYMDNPGGHFSWPLDGLTAQPGHFEQHCKFIDFKNKNWNSVGVADYNKFLKTYVAELLKGAND